MGRMSFVLSLGNVGFCLILQVMKRFFTVFLMLVVFLGMNAFDRHSGIKFHCERDTMIVCGILSDMKESGKRVPGEMILDAALKLSEILVSASDSRDYDNLNVNVCGMDSRMFVESALALAKSAVRSGRLWTDYADELESLVFRRGEYKGFSSRLLYVSDWITDNIYRGNFREVTDMADTPGYMEKTLDYISRHPELYPALKDSANLRSVSDMEMGLLNFRMPYLRKEALRKKKCREFMRNGDIILFLPSDPGFDMGEIGIIVMSEGEPCMLHVSEKNGGQFTEVCVLRDYVRYEGRGFSGWRLFRVEEL